MFINVNSPSHQGEGEVDIGPVEPKTETARTLITGSFRMISNKSDLELKIKLILENRCIETRTKAGRKMARKKRNKRCLIFKQIFEH